MCRCTPEIRTPFCGRGDCLPPASREPTESLFAANAEREFARMAHGDHLAQFKADQLAAWERRLAQFSNRSDSTGYVGRIGVEVLTELRQSREQAEAATALAERATDDAEQGMLLYQAACKRAERAEKQAVALAAALADARRWMMATNDYESLSPAGHSLTRDAISIAEAALRAYREGTK